MAEPNDEALLQRWRNGDAEAGDALAVRYCAAVLSFFANKVPEGGEDLMQKTFLACLDTDPAQEIRSFRAFLFGIARMQLLRYYERRGQLRGEEMMSRVSLAGLATTPTERIARAESHDLLHRALATLPLDQQIALELFYWQKLPVAEVASALSLSEGGTRAKLHRARQKLRNVYEELSGGAVPPGMDE